MSFRFLAISALAAISGVSLGANASVAAPGYMVATGQLLSGPAADYAVLAKLPAGTHVNIVWCGTRQNWCLIAEHGAMGWLPMAELNTVGGGGPLNQALAGGQGAGAPGSLSASGVFAAPPPVAEPPVTSPMPPLHPVSPL